MKVTLVHIYIKKECIDQFLAELEILHNLSLQEEGVIAYDIIQDELDKGKFVIIETYTNDEAEELHRNAEHTSAWRKKAAPWLAYARVHIKHQVIFPKELISS